MSREDNVKVFNDTMKMCKNDKLLSEYIRKSKSSQKVFLESDVVEKSSKGYDLPAKVVVSRKKSFESALAYRDKKVCVLNFASATNAGGGVVNGSNAQEESLCRCSTLFPCISDESIVKEFHQRHRNMLHSGEMSALYNDDCIYTPDVVIFKDDTVGNNLLSKDKWFKLDVVSCAAPNLRERPSNVMNPDSGDKRVVLKPSELLNLHIKRLGRVFEIAKTNGVEVLILGAFGCGAFQNPPTIVAEAFARVLKDYLYDFDTIEFAVYCTPRDIANYDTFNRRLSKIGR